MPILTLLTKLLNTVYGCSKLPWAGHACYSLQVLVTSTLRSVEAICTQRNRHAWRLLAWTTTDADRVAWYARLHVPQANHTQTAGPAAGRVQRLEQTRRCLHNHVLSMETV